MRRLSKTNRIATWTYQHWTGIAAAAIALALILTLALLPGPSAGSLTSPAAGGSVYGPAVPLSSTPAWPSPTTTTAPTTPYPPSSPIGAPQAQPYVPTTTPTVVSAGGDATSTDTPDWACIREHESGDNYSDGNGGAYQFEDGTWQSTTGTPGPAEDYSPAQQDAAALELYNERGWEPWTTRWVCGLG